MNVSHFAAIEFTSDQSFRVSDKLKTNRNPLVCISNMVRHFLSYGSILGWYFIS